MHSGRLAYRFALLFAASIELTGKAGLLVVLSIILEGEGVTVSNDQGEACELPLALELLGADFDRPFAVLASCLRPRCKSLGNAANGCGLP